MSKLPSIEYLAGLFDGEGSISIVKVNAGNCLSMRVQLGNTYRDIPYAYKQIFDGSVAYLDPTKYTNKGNISREPQWRWKVVGWKALDFLVEVFPFLIIKAGQAEIAMEFQSRRTGPGNYRTECDIKLDEADKVLIQSLNSRKGKQHEQES